MSSSNVAASRRFPSSAMTATAKRPAMAENACGAKVAGPAAAQQAKKRVALGNITNVAAASGARGSGSGKAAAPAANARFSSTPAKKGSLTSVRNVSANRGSAVKPPSTKPAPVISRHDCSTQKESVPPPKRFNSAPVKKESLASVRNASTSRSSAVKPTSTKPAPVISRNDCSTQKESVPPPKRYSSTPVKKGSLATVRNASVNRSSAVKPASTKPAPVISSHDFSTQKESVPLRKSFSSAPVKKGSLASVRNASTNRGSAVKTGSTKPAPVISSHDFSTQKESVPRPKRFSSTPVNKGSLASLRNASANRGSAVKPASNKPAPVISRHDCSTQKESVPPPKMPIVVPNVVPAIVPCSSFVSPGHSADSISIDETMSTCDSMKSPDFEYINNGDSLLDSLQRQVNENLHISEDRDAEGTKWKKDAPSPIEIDNICDVDDNYDDPQLCATLASDIYMHLREAETRKRPSTDFLETIQKDVNPSMRAILIDWLVEVAEEYRLVPDTLYLTVNYIDRYLSGNEINRQRLQLLGVACMLIAAKYEEICAPQVEEFCYITDDTYFKDEVLDMEASVLNYLKFEMTAPTAKCFLRRFVRAAQVCDEDPELHLEFLANYVAELSLLEYSLISYPPSLVAASAIFLSKFILQPTKHPWNSTLAHYTQYKPSELCDCVKALHRLFSVGPGSNLPAIREKYSQEKYKFVAKKQCPPSVPTEFFRDATCWTISQE